MRRVAVGCLGVCRARGKGVRRARTSERSKDCVRVGAEEEDEEEDEEGDEEESETAPPEPSTSRWVVFVSSSANQVWMLFTTFCSLSSIETPSVYTRSAQQDAPQVQTDLQDATPMRRKYKRVNPVTLRPVTGAVTGSPARGNKRREHRTRWVFFT